ncbi:L-arabinose ABC transporter ATP-binding protein AraG, partial [Burkholderia multivorans]
RKQEGIVAIASVADNLNISARRHFSPARMLLDARRERELAQRYIERLAIKTRDGDTPIGALPAGNQQKVVL